MEEHKCLNLKDIWNKITEIDKQNSSESSSYGKQESLQDLLSNFNRMDNENHYKHDVISKNNFNHHDESFENLNSQNSWESSFETPPYSNLSSNSLQSRSFNSSFQPLDEMKEFIDFPKSDIKRENFENNGGIDMISANLFDGINDKILNTILDNLATSSNQKDFFSKSNVVSIINSLLQKQLTKMQYKKIQKVVLAIYGNSNNYYTDPLQGFYNQELLMLLLKNQSLPKNQNDKIMEPIQRLEPNKNLNIHNGNQVSLKDEIAMLSMSYRNMMGVFENDIEKAAALYRTSAIMAQKNEAAYQWTGKLPVTSYKLCQYSRKVFLGGVPWDSSENDLISAFIKFGYLSVMFPQKDVNGSMRHGISSNSLKGYCYIIFESEDSVNKLLSQCTKSESNIGDFYKISSPKFRSKDVQVIPWMIQDSQYCKQGSQKPDSKKTVFVGALHGMMTAYALANVMNELFDSVIFTALDTDKYKYPIGSGRVTFSSQKSYMRAVTANFIHVKTAKFSKTIQIDPYLEDSMCNNCFQSPGIYFCRSFECFRYFCSGCWQVWHNRCETLFNHKPLRRTFKPIFDMP